MPKQTKPRFKVDVILKESVNKNFHNSNIVTLDFFEKQMMKEKLRDILTGGGLHLNEGKVLETIYPAHMIRKILVTNMELIEDKGEEK